jgi:hypothetical protein
MKKLLEFDFRGVSVFGYWLNNGLGTLYKDSSVVHVLNVMDKTKLFNYRYEPTQERLDIEIQDCRRIQVPIFEGKNDPLENDCRSIVIMGSKINKIKSLY